VIHDLACASLGFVEDESEQTRKSLLELLAAQAIESPGRARSSTVTWVTGTCT
jgi:hypothetical protein